MSPQLLEKIAGQLVQEQRLTLSSVRWQQYEVLRGILYDIPGVRTAYLDGKVEIVTLKGKTRRYQEPD